MTGLIYLVIIALWAAVLIPMWLRRNDTGVEYRSAHTFNRAMRTLRRQRSHYAGYREPHATLQPRRDRVAEVVVPKARRTVRSPQSAARRRLAVMVTLAALSLLTVVLGVIGVLPAWLVLLPAVLLAGFVVLVRRAVAVEHRRTVSRRSGRQAEAPRSRSASPRRSAPAYDVDEDRDDFEAPSTAAVARAEGAWHAVPTTLPRYVTAPRATGIPRVIDLTHSEEWTSTAILREGTSQRDRERAELRSRVVDFEARPAPVEFFDQYADEAADRRAVND